MTDALIKEQSNDHEMRGTLGLVTSINSNPDYHKDRLNEVNNNGGKPFEVAKINSPIPTAVLSFLTSTFTGEAITGFSYIDDPQIIKQLAVHSEKTITVDKPQLLGKAAGNIVGNHNPITLPIAEEKRKEWQMSRNMTITALNQSLSAQRKAIETQERESISDMLGSLIKEQMDAKGFVNFNEITPVLSMKVLDQNTFNGKLESAIRTVMPKELQGNPYLYLSEIFNSALSDGLGFKLFPNKFETQEGKLIATDVVEKIINQMVINYTYGNEGKENNTNSQGILNHIKMLTELNLDGSKSDYNLRFEGATGMTLNSNALRNQPEVMEYWQSIIRTIILAGHETTKSLMNSAVAIATGSHDSEGVNLVDMLQLEISDIPELTEKDILPNSNLETKLPFLVALVEESLRMYPPTGVLFRFLLDDLEVEAESGNKHTLKKGTLVLANTLIANRMGNTWGPNPEQINIFRWLEIINDHDFKLRKDIESFGFGIPSDDRRCLGEPFARWETYIMLFNLFKNYKIENQSKLAGQVLIPENNSALAGVQEEMIDKVVLTRK